MNISLVGATGAVGAELTKLLEASQIPVNRLRLLASRNSAGRQVRFRDEICFVEALDEIGDLETDIAFLCAGSAVSAEWGPRFAAQGALLIDNSSTFRMNPDVLLVLPQVNPSVLSDRPRRGIVANPNCSTIQLIRQRRIGGKLGPPAARFPPTSTAIMSAPFRWRASSTNKTVLGDYLTRLSRNKPSHLCSAKSGEPPSCQVGT